MATPYLQITEVEVPSTQDLARQRAGSLPLVVMSPRQTSGRGRLGAHWKTAQRAVAVSLAFAADLDDRRPFSLMAGVAASRVVDVDTSLKWPNDVMNGAGVLKIGGILTERFDELVVCGLGLNLFWPQAEEGVGEVYPVDPGPDRYAELAGLWAAEMLSLVDGEGWPLTEYSKVCTTLGRKITWEPEGSGQAVDVTAEGALVVISDNSRQELRSGAVRHVSS